MGRQRVPFVDGADQVAEELDRLAARRVPGDPSLPAAIAGAEDDLGPATAAIIVEDHSDLYSHDLASRLDSDPGLEVVGTAFGTGEAETDLDGDIGDPAVACDAVLAMSTAINQSTLDADEITPEMVADALANGVDFAGLTGWISLSDEDRVPDDKPIFIVDAGEAPMLVCGSFDDGASKDRWGGVDDDGFPCPEAD